MINTRMNHDKVTYSRKLAESSYYSKYVLDHTTRDHTNKALHTFGLLGGPIVSNNYTDIIDLESQLKGIQKKKNR